jgi:succinate dehydrogenase/fumarate reductase flavoprotein subunit
VIRRVTADVLIIGCGPAGLLAALEVKKKGVDVLAIDKGIIGNDCSAVGAKQVAGTGPWSGDDDNPDIHMEDTLKSGCYINDPKLTRILVDRIGRVVQDLEKMGMPFSRDKTGEKIDLSGPAPGHSKARSLYFSDITGKLLVETIYAECRRRGVRMHSEHVAVELVKGKDGIAGALVVDIKSGELMFVRTKAVVIATGGIGRLYELTSNPVQNTGDGIALAMRAGAELMDLEFVQFYPCTALAPPGIRGMNLNSQHHGAQLYNSEGERFMSKYYPKEMEFTTRDKLSRSIFREILTGKVGPNGGVFLDATMIPGEEYARDIPTEWNLAVSVGIDLTKDMLEIAPSCHYYMGGVRIDERCRTTVRGLFATGECTSGVQGANRLANNGLAEALVFGVVAGESAAQYASKAAMPTYRESDLMDMVYRMSGLFDKNGKNPLEVLHGIQKTMTKYVGVVRDEAALSKGIDLLKELGSQKIEGCFGEAWSPRILHGLSLRNMAMLGQAIAKAAKERKESRGAHYRSDYPEINDDEWRANIVVKLDDQGNVALRRQDTGARGCTDWVSTQ